MPILYHRHTESEMMAAARAALDKRRLDGPAFQYVITQAAAPPSTPAQAERRMRSLRACHLPSLYERPRHAPPEDTGAYVPSTAARLDNDLNLTDGARRCARKIMEETYRRDRAGRKLQVTVNYLAKALGRSCRTIQRYLRILEREGYLLITVIAGYRSRLCIGLVIQLLTPLFPRHHKDKWPESRIKPATTEVSENKGYIYLRSYNPRFRALHDLRCHTYAREAWAEKCMQGVFRALV